MESEDVHELVKIHKIELNTDELLHLQEEQQTTLADDDLSSVEGEAMESVPISLIKEMCAKWGKRSYLWENITQTPSGK